MTVSPHAWGFLGHIRLYLPFLTFSFLSVLCCRQLSNRLICGPLLLIITIFAESSRIAYFAIQIGNSTESP